MQMWKLIAAALYGASAVRTRRPATSEEATSKFIGNVPILNYHLAHQKTSSMVDGEAPKENWIVVVKKGVSDQHIENACAQGKCLRKGHPSKGGVPFFEVHASEEELVKIVEAAGADVKFIEPDSEVYMIPEMPATQDSPSWGLDRVGAPKRGNEGAGSHVYVLDTGIRASHSDFGGRVIPTLDMSIGSGVVCGEDASSCTNDAQGHGTHCAGTAAGASFGVAPKAAIHAVKVLSDQGSGSWSWSVEALDFLATKGERPAVSSMSLGGQGVLAAMGEAVEAAVDAGVVVVVAGGNSNRDACGFSPAYSPAAITVGSTTKGNTRSSFSNYGSCTEIWAPGSDITSASHRSDTGSATFSGTSMACPHVSGGAALVLERNPDLSAQEVLEEMLKFGIADSITGLKTGDTNRMLYVGADAVEKPLPAPTPAPPSDGKCGFLCSELVCFLDACKDCGFCKCSVICSEKNCFHPGCKDCDFCQ